MIKEETIKALNTFLGLIINGLWQYTQSISDFLQITVSITTHKLDLPFCIQSYLQQKQYVTNGPQGRVFLETLVFFKPFKQLNPFMQEHKGSQKRPGHSATGLYPHHHITFL